mmetsp:Transcript_6980/g.22265  ORF Transcript_6980/g.22265 Transcript_6980/m.22265 type:complete len:255 (+) Transcript_6980:1064-1828(+)
MIWRHRRTNPRLPPRAPIPSSGPAAHQRRPPRPHRQSRRPCGQRRPSSQLRWPHPHPHPPRLSILSPSRRVPSQMTCLSSPRPRPGVCTPSDWAPAVRQPWLRLDLATLDSTRRSPCPLARGRRGRPGRQSPGQTGAGAMLWKTSRRRLHRCRCLQRTRGTPQPCALRYSLTTRRRFTPRRPLRPRPRRSPSPSRRCSGRRRPGVGWTLRSKTPMPARLSSSRGAHTRVPPRSCRPTSRSRRPWPPRPCRTTRP